MRKKILQITETAVMLAMLVALQAVTRPLGQLVTGSFVNGVLAVTVLVSGLGSGVTVAVFSPVLAFLLNIAPQAITVPAIMVGNTVFVVLLYFIAGKDSRKLFRQLLAWLAAATAKFVTLYVIVVWLICGVLAKGPKALSAMFSWPQLFTALIGGAVALVITPILRKALKK